MTKHKKCNKIPLYIPDIIYDDNITTVSNGMKQLLMKLLLNGLLSISISLSLSLSLPSPVILPSRFPGVTSFTFKYLSIASLPNTISLLFPPGLTLFPSLLGINIHVLFLH